MSGRDDINDAKNAKKKRRIDGEGALGSPAALSVGCGQERDDKLMQTLNQLYL